jgi:hypothetical protein
MSKQSGLGDNLYVDGVDISGDIGSIGSISGPLGVLPFTNITQSAHERKAGLGDGAMSFSSYFNPDTGMTHDKLSVLPTANVVASYFRGQTLGAPAASLVAKQIGYDPNRGADGSLVLASALTASAGYSLEWGRQGTAGKRTDTGATSGSSVDGVAASSFGLIAYLHVFAFTGTSVTVKLQQSSDNGVGDAWADVTGGAFVAATAAGVQRVATSAVQAVERYLRVVTTGTFTSAVFAVNIVRNRTADA